MYYLSESYIKNELNEHCLPFTPFKIKYKSKAVKKGDKTFYPSTYLNLWLQRNVY
jgi:hypothetical protein